jgi:hypothetical protein
MIDLAWSQISGAVAGGVVGVFSGFVANHLQQRQELIHVRRSVASALIGEIEALAQFIEQNFLARMRGAVQPPTGKRAFPYRPISGERDYMPVFRGLGGSVGALPSPLPRGLVTWYARLAASLERARELHELALDRNPEASAYAAEIVELQRAELTELISSAKPLLDRLSSVMGRGHA